MFTRTRCFSRTRPSSALLDIATIKNLVIFPVCVASIAALRKQGTHIEISLRCRMIKEQRGGFESIIICREP